MSATDNPASPASNDLPPDVVAGLNSFDAGERQRALAKAADELQSGRRSPPEPNGSVNVHAHTFYSFSSRELSPYGLTWEARRRGLTIIGSTDFDVLDAMEEMFTAGETLSMPTTASLEARTYVDAYAEWEINSPGEPGVMYAMGAGFVRKPAPDSWAGELFASLAAQSRRRNIEMVAKVNPVVGPAAIEYDRDVLTLTPSGNATERHLCAAYDEKARKAFPDQNELAVFWGGVLGIPGEKAFALLADSGALRNAIRARLMKKGGVGYAQPGPETFPKIEDFFKMIADARALPCLTWLDGLSFGECDPGRLLDDALNWGARTVNIIPDRNWNLVDSEAKKTKLTAMDAFIREARRRNLPVLVGTEMNSPGQKFVDSFDAQELAPYVGDFRDGAFFLYGHTALERLAGIGAASDWAATKFAGDWIGANAFYTEAGRRMPPGYMRTVTVPDGASPEDVLSSLA